MADRQVPSFFCWSVIFNIRLLPRRYTVLEHYLFHARSQGDMLLALGLGSLFNHNHRPNLDYRVDALQQAQPAHRTNVVEMTFRFTMHQHVSVNGIMLVSDDTML